MENEIWKDIPEYVGYYQVSNLGRVRSLDRYVKDMNRNRIQFISGKILKPSDSGKGYLKVYLTKNSKKRSFFVHRLVAEAFIPNPNNLPEVNHINLNKSKNYVENLEWVSSSENKKHYVSTEIGRQKRAQGGRTRFNNIVKGKINNIIEDYTSDKVCTIQQLADKYGICKSTVTKILKEKNITIRLKSNKGTPLKGTIIQQYNLNNCLLASYNNYLDIYNILRENNLTRGSYDTVSGEIYKAINSINQKRYGFIWKKVIIDGGK